MTSLLKFLLDSLQHCGSHYSIVFKALSEFCHGHSFLSTNDRSYLFEQLKKSKFDAEIAELEGKVCVCVCVRVCVCVCVCVNTGTSIPCLSYLTQLVL